MTTMTDDEFEKWWEGLGERERDFEVYDLLGHNLSGRDREWVENFEECVPGYTTIWQCAGEVLDYARTHEPPEGCPTPEIRAGLDAYSNGRREESPSSRIRRMQR